MRSKLHPSLKLFIEKAPRLLCIFLGCFFLVSSIYANATSFHKRKRTTHDNIIELRSDDQGLFSNLLRSVEWAYCVKHNENFWRLYLNMNGAYGFQGNTFSALFKPFEDSQISITPFGSSKPYLTIDYPRNFYAFNKHPTDGMKNFEVSKYVYMNKALYKDPDFSLFRERLHSIILHYFQPVPELQEKIDIISKKMNGENASLSPRPMLKIGIHVRCLQHYLGCKKSPSQFLDDVERDIDLIMASKDPQTTQIFLATQLQPLVDRLSAKYKIITCDIPRAKDVVSDWTSIAHADPLDTARDALVDTWCLANCDELWCASSNMVVFAACLNPHLKIYMLPSLENYNGA